MCGQNDAIKTVLPERRRKGTVYLSFHPRIDPFTYEMSLDWKLNLAERHLSLQQKIIYELLADVPETDC